MRPIDVTLGLREGIPRGLEDGTLHRYGGVVRDEAGRIVALLPDSKVAESPLRDLVDSNVVPLIVQGISFRTIDHRLKRIESQLAHISDQIAEVGIELRLAHVKLDAVATGRLIGTIMAADLDLRGGNTVGLPGHRATLLQAQCQLQMTSAQIAGDSDLVQRHPEVLANYARLTHLAGVAAVELSLRMGEPEAAEQIARMAAADAESIAARLAATLRAPSSLFWRDRRHLEIASELRESTHRLTGHVVMLSERLLPADTRKCGQLDR